MFIFLFPSITGFKGNPAAVILLRPDQDIPDETRLAIASEFALSETAFARPVEGRPKGVEAT